MLRYGEIITNYLLFILIKGIMSLLNHIYYF